jgi:hypothetical protein
LLELFSRDVSADFERSAKKSPAQPVSLHAQSLGFSVDVVEDSVQVGGGGGGDGY